MASKLIPCGDCGEMVRFTESNPEGQREWNVEEKGAPFCERCIQRRKKVKE